VKRVGIGSRCLRCIGRDDGWPRISTVEAVEMDFAATLVELGLIRADRNPPTRRKLTIG
jgi:hypothetical protein